MNPPLETHGGLDYPDQNSASDPLCLRLEGWICPGEREAELEGIEIQSDGQTLAYTNRRFPRPDITGTFRGTTWTAVGFEIFLNAPGLLGRESVMIECLMLWKSGEKRTFARRQIRLIRHDHRNNHYGCLVDLAATRLFHRSDIYGSGPSVEHPSQDCLALVRRHLGPPSGKVLDVGCGIGAYGVPLRQDGYDWFGVEVKESDAVVLAGKGLPHQLITGDGLPFSDGEYENAMCIEVLEHIADPDLFLKEIRRVTSRQLLLSVPNLEILPYLHGYQCVPWHLLEADHKNFFTRASLSHLLRGHFSRVEVVCYGMHPLRGPENIPLFYHLFACAEV